MYSAAAPCCRQHRFQGEGEGWVWGGSNPSPLLPNWKLVWGLGLPPSSSQLEKWKKTNKNSENFKKNQKMTNNRNNLKMHKKKTNERHDKNEERRGPNPEKVEAQRASAGREGGRRVEPGGMGARRVGGPEGWGPDLEKVGARRVGARRVGPRSVGARSSQTPPVFHTTAREPKRAHLRVPAPQTPPKFHARTPKRGNNERKLWWERGKKREMLGGAAEEGSGGGNEKKIKKSNYLKNK